MRLSIDPGWLNGCVNRACGFLGAAAVAPAHCYWGRVWHGCCGKSVLVIGAVIVRTEPIAIGFKWAVPQNLFGGWSWTSVFPMLAIAANGAHRPDVGNAKFHLRMVQGELAKALDLLVNDLFRKRLAEAVVCADGIALATKPLCHVH